jgi:hypothetical protein
MAFRKIVSPTGKTFHWKCESLNCPFESEEITISKVRIGKNITKAQPPIRCPKCGCRYPAAFVHHAIQTVAISKI